MSQDYYFWRDYAGKTPADAVSLGKDAVGDPIYVGQVYVQTDGLFVGTLKKDQAFIVVAAHGVHTLDKNIKILCSDSSNVNKLVWKETTSTNFLPDILETPPVVGGTDGLTPGTIYVGSLVQDSETIIGSIVLLNNSTNPSFYYVLNNQQYSTGAFQVLTVVNE